MPLEAARKGPLHDIVRLMAPQPGRFEFATRLAVICALTVLVVEIYQTPDAALTVYVVFFLNRGDRTVSIILSFALVALITVIVGFTLLVAMIVVNDPMWRVISMTLISIAILFVASASKLRPIGGIIALIVGYALDLLGTTPLANGELATRSLLYAWLFVGIPAGMLICGALVVIAFSQTRALFGSGASILVSCLPVSVAATLVGLFLMVSHRQALMQVVGLVLVENAIFLAAVSLTYGMPLLVEMGVLLDLLAGVAVLGLFVARIEETHGDSDTTKLSSLKG